MVFNLIIPDKIPEKLKGASSKVEVKKEWKKINATSCDDIIRIIANKIQSYDDRINIEKTIISTKQNIKSKIEGVNKVSDFLGYLSNENNDVCAYVFFTPPNTNGSSTFLAQQVIPTISYIIDECIIDSPCYRLTNRPIYIINLNEVVTRMTSDSVAVNIISAIILEFNYIDIFNFSLAFSPDSINCIADYDRLLKNTNTEGKNEIFELNVSAKKVKFLKCRLKDGINVNNEPYWFALKAYAAAYLASMEDYELDISEIETLKEGNNALDAFRHYVKKI